MVKMLSEIIGMPIYEDSGSPRPISMVRDVIIDIETGHVVAFMTPRGRILLFTEAQFFTSGIFIHSADDLLNRDEVVRVDRLLQKNPFLLGRAVYIDKTKQYIGRVTDLEIDLRVGTLLNLHTSQFVLFFRYDRRIISARNIVQVKPDGIYIKDTTKVKAGQPVEAENLVPA